MQAHYLVYTHYPDLGLACSDPHTFSDACDQYDSRRHDGYDATVMRVEPPQNGQAGMMIDVTSDAIEKCRQRCRANGYDFHGWLLEEMA